MVVLHWGSGGYGLCCEVCGARREDGSAALGQRRENAAMTAPIGVLGHGRAGALSAP